MPMRIRAVKPDYFLHEDLFKLEIKTSLPIRVAFAGLWCAADREGRFKWEPGKLKAQILPYDQVEFEEVLNALATSGFIIKYTLGCKNLGCIPTFKAHQVVNNREKESELPPPDEISIQIAQSQVVVVQMAQINDACFTPLSPDQEASYVALDPDRVEGKGREQEGNRKGTLASSDACEPKKPQVPRPRCPLLDTLVALDGSDPLVATSAAFGPAAKALKDIRSVAPDVTPDEIRRRAANYKREWPTISISALALAKHWARFDREIIVTPPLPF